MKLTQSVVGKFLGTVVSSTALHGLILVYYTAPSAAVANAN
jgi:hypothetical protein